MWYLAACFYVRVQYVRLANMVLYRKCGRFFFSRTGYQYVYRERYRFVVYLGSAVMPFSASFFFVIRPAPSLLVVLRTENS